MAVGGSPDNVSVGFASQGPPKNKFQLLILCIFSEILTYFTYKSGSVERLPVETVVRDVNYLFQRF